MGSARCSTPASNLRTPTVACGARQRRSLLPSPRRSDNKHHVWAREAATFDQGGASSFPDGSSSVLMVVYQRGSSGECFSPSSEKRTIPSSLFFPAYDEAGFTGSLVFWVHLLVFIGRFVGLILAKRLRGLNLIIGLVLVASGVVAGGWRNSEGANGGGCLDSATERVKTEGRWLSGLWTEVRWLAAGGGWRLALRLARDRGADVRWLAASRLAE
nr:hypothetical protein Iba_chr12fCG10620 [Ipomoea batatas]